MERGSFLFSQDCHVTKRLEEEPFNPEHRLNERTNAIFGRAWGK
jgi:hypothetical protein